MSREIINTIVQANCKFDKFSVYVFEIDFTKKDCLKAGDML